MPDKAKNQDPFIPNENVQYRNQSFGANEGIDFYIDYARFLPDNATVTKCILRAFNRDMVRMIQRAEGTPDLTESTTYSPYFGFRYEFRLPHYDPTMLVAITIETIDRSTLEPAYLGHAFFPLFLDKKSKKPTSESSAQGFILQEGNYQIPIYCQKPPTAPPFTFDILSELEKIPTASLLIRVRRAATKDGYKVLSIKDVPNSEWETSGLVEPAPDYGDEKYNTSYCNINSAELIMFNERAKRYDPQLVDTCKYLQQALNLPPPQHREFTNEWIDELIQSDENTGYLDMRYFAPYSRELGFKIAVDGFHNTPHPIPYGCIVSLNPPGGLYTEEQPGPARDVNVASTLDYASPLRSFHLLDGFFNYKDIPGEQLFRRNRYPPYRPVAIFSLPADSDFFATPLLKVF